MFDMARDITISKKKKSVYTSMNSKEAIKSVVNSERSIDLNSMIFKGS